MQNSPIPEGDTVSTVFSALFSKNIDQGDRGTNVQIVTSLVPEPPIFKEPSEFIQSVGDEPLANHGNHIVTTGG